MVGEIRRVRRECESKDGSVSEKEWRFDVEVKEEGKGGFLFIYFKMLSFTLAKTWRCTSLN